MNHNDLLSKDLLKLMLGSNNVFLANVLLNLKRVFTDEIPTCAVSVTSLLINPDFYFSRSDSDRQFIMLHEASHLIFNDLGRMAGLDPDRANRAFDYYINAMLKRDGWTVPEGALYEQRFDGLEKAEIYKILEEEDPDNTSPKDMLHGDMEDLAGDMEGKGTQEIQAALDNLVQQAAVQAKSCGGKLPKVIEQYLEDLYNPKLRWNEILQKYMQEVRKDDYSWQRLNRRYLPHGICLPTLYSEGMGTVAVAIDTSGSVSDKEYQTFIGGVSEILDQCEPDQVDVVAFTHELVNQWTLHSLADVKDLKFRSSGGTDLRPVFEHFNQNKPTVLIIFSDMECIPWTEQTSYDVINIVVGRQNYKGIGKSINITI